MTTSARPPWVSELLEKLEKAVEGLDKAAIAEWIELYRRPRKLLFLNFISGVARGFGIGIGFTLVSTAILVLLGRIARLNLPVVSEFLADIIRLVQLELRGL